MMGSMDGEVTAIVAFVDEGEDAAASQKGDAGGGQFDVEAGFIRLLGQAWAGFSVDFDGEGDDAVGEVGVGLGHGGGLLGAAG